MLLEMFAPNGTVLIDATSGTIVSRADIEQRAAAWAGRSASITFLLADGSIECATEFHVLLEAGMPVALLDAAASADQIGNLLARYRPEFVCAPEHWVAPAEYSKAGPRLWSRVPDAPPSAAPHPDLAVLLTTSGSTGSPKFVRLSKHNIQANAEQIAESLNLTPTDRGATALPLHYSFGMSILTSHAGAGSPVVVTSGSVIEPAFWQALDEHQVTLLPGVPQTYQMLTRLRFTDRFLPSVPSLRALMQAGGRLHRELVAALAEAMAQRDGEFFVMYGQTEAAPRIACLPPARLREKLGAAGVALVGGHLEARGNEGQILPPGEAGEIFYTGPNVMMGYAESREDLALGDTHGDTLATGDLGYVDAEGFLFLTGRAKRIAKVAGLRVSLDEVETLAAQLGLDDPVAVEASEGVISLAVATAGVNDPAAVVKQLTRAMRLPAKTLRAELVEAIPLLPSGKIDYASLRTMLLDAPASGIAPQASRPQGENQT